MCVNTRARNNDISNDLGEATAPANQPESKNGNKALPKQFRVHHSEVKKIIHKTVETAAYLAWNKCPRTSAPSANLVMLWEIKKDKIKQTHKLHLLQASLPGKQSPSKNHGTIALFCKNTFEQTICCLEKCPLRQGQIGDVWPQCTIPWLQEQNATHQHKAGHWKIHTSARDRLSITQIISYRWGLHI